MAPELSGLDLEDLHTLTFFAGAVTVDHIHFGYGLAAMLASQIGDADRQLHAVRSDFDLEGLQIFEADITSHVHRFVIERSVDVLQATNRSIDKAREHIGQLRDDALEAMCGAQAVCITPRPVFSDLNERVSHLLGTFGDEVIESLEPS